VTNESKYLGDIVHLGAGTGDPGVSRMSDEELTAVDKLGPYWKLLWYEYALRRSAGLDPEDSVRWSMRRVVSRELDPVLALIGGYDPHSDDMTGMLAGMLLETLKATGEELFQTLQSTDGWRPGTDGMGW
jgi:hypothetical protein